MLRHDFRSDLRFGNSHRKRHGSRANCFAQFCARAPNAKNSFARQRILLIWGMDLSTLANVATALTVLTSVVFGLIEMRRARREREERGAFAAVQALMSPEWMSSAVLVAAIPDGSRAAEIEGDQKLLEAGLKMATIMEGIGYSVFAHIVPLSVADDLVVGTARVAWRKLRPFIEFERERSGSQKSWEWFQWLVEQLERHGQSKTSLKVGAPIAYRDWKPSQYQNGSRDDRECSYDAHSYCGRWIWPGRGPTVQTRAGGARDLRRDSSDSHPRVDEVDAGRTQYSGGSSVSDIEADPRVVDASQAVGVIL